MEKKKVEALISWSGNNYCATSVGTDINGVVIVTNRSLQKVKSDFIESLKFHIEGLLHDGDKVQQWLQNEDYEINYTMDISAILHSLDGILTRSAISRVTGINERQLGHYASGHRVPRPVQQQKILEGIHEIGRELIVV
jgi:hypothetical protein